MLLVVLMIGAACGDTDSEPEVEESQATSTQAVAESTTPQTSLPPDPTTSTSTAPTATAPQPVRMFAVDDLAFDTDGVLWATTGEDRSYSTGVSAGTPRMLYRLIGDTWERVEQPTTVYDNPGHWEIRAAADGGVYLASGFDGPPSPTSGVYFTDGTTWELYGQEFLCGSLAVDSAGQLWATCPDFVTTLVNGEWQDLPEGWSAQSVAAGADGSVWFTSFSPPFELWRFDGSDWTTVGTCEDCWGPRSILGIDDQGAAWVARGECGLDGITKFDPSGVTEELDVRGGRDVAFTDDGAAWVALPCEDASAPAGVAQVSNGEVRVFTTADGLPDNDVQAIELGPDGGLYAGTEYGVHKYDPTTDTWTPVGGF